VTFSLIEAPAHMPSYLPRFFNRDSADDSGAGKHLRFLTDIPRIPKVVARFWPSSGLHRSKVRPRTAALDTESHSYLALRRWDLAICPHQDAPLPSWSAPFERNARHAGAGGARNWCRTAARRGRRVKRCAISHQELFREHGGSMKTDQPAHGYRRRWMFATMSSWSMTGMGHEERFSLPNLSGSCGFG
jgi:hypothetical protein